MNNDLNIITYTENDIKNALGVINPNIKHAMEADVYLSIPLTLNFLLLEYFVKREMGSITEEYNKAGQMLLKAYNDIEQHGHFLYKTGD